MGAKPVSAPPREAATGAALRPLFYKKITHKNSMQLLPHIAF